MRKDCVKFLALLKEHSVYLRELDRSNRIIKLKPFNVWWNLSVYDNFGAGYKIYTEEETYLSKRRVCRYDGISICIIQLYVSLQTWVFLPVAQSFVLIYYFLRYIIFLRFFSRTYRYFYYCDNYSFMIYNGELFKYY